MSTVADKTTRIRVLNDAFRSTFLGGKVKLDGKLAQPASRAGDDIIGRLAVKAGPVFVVKLRWAVERQHDAVQVMADESGEAFVEHAVG